MPDSRTTHARYQTRSQEAKAAGMPCPSCDTFIPMTLQDLLSNRSFRCPKRECRTHLRLDPRGSSSALSALRNFKDRLEDFQPSSG